MKTHLSGPPLPKFEANTDYIPTSPPSSMKQCNKSAAVKFHMELLLILRPGSNLATPWENICKKNLESPPYGTRYCRGPSPFQAMFPHINHKLIKKKNISYFL